MNIFKDFQFVRHSSDLSTAGDQFWESGHTV